MIASWIRLRRPYNSAEVDQGVVLAPVSLLVLLLGRAASQFEGSVASTLRNPFTDSHAVSTLTDITVNDLDRVDMSTYQAGDTNGRL
jgi:hypothetical protein